MSRFPVYGYFSFLLLPCLGLADTSMSAPVTGYVTDSSQSALRAILGVPGALRFSEPLRLPSGATRVRLAPGRDFAWLERSGDVPGVLFLSGGSAAGLTPVTGALAAADWVAFSPGAAGAVLFSSSAGRLQVLTGLPDAPQVVSDLDTSTFPEPPLAAAVSDGGDVLLIASQTAVYLLAQGGTAQVVWSGQTMQSLAMMPNGTDAVAADSGAGSVYLIRNVASAPAGSILASNLAGIGTVYPVADGSAVLVTQPGGQTVSTIDMVSSALQSFPMDAAPVALQQLSNRGAFLVSSKPGEPGWIFLRTGNAGQVIFVPAIPSAAAAAQ